MLLLLLYILIIRRDNFKKKLTYIAKAQELKSIYLLYIFETIKNTFAFARKATLNTIVAIFDNFRL